MKALYSRTHGRKLHAELGRFATRVKISEMRRCCTLVSWVVVSTERDNRSRAIYQLCVELGQSRLTGIVEDEDCVDHGVDSLW